MLYYLDELNGRIDPGYERVENEMSNKPYSNDPIIRDGQIDYEMEQEQRKRDIKQAKFATIIVEALIDAVKASDGEFAKLVLSDKLAEITNKATRALLEIE